MIDEIQGNWRNEKCCVEWCSRLRAQRKYKMCDRHYRLARKHGEVKKTAVEKSLEERLFSKRSVNKKTGCWEWTGFCMPFGHGMIGLGPKMNRKTGLTHRVSAALYLGFDLFSPLKVCHHCDNPPCFNPSHLFIGTDKDNYDDMVSKGRRNKAVGERASKAKLNRFQVERMRLLHEMGLGCKKLGKMFRVSSNSVIKINNRATWNHI